MHAKASFTSLLLLGGLVAGACSTDSGLMSLCEPGQIARGTQCLDDIGVSTNSVGFLPGRVKRAAYLGGGDFEVVNTESGEVAFSGTGTGPTAADGGVMLFLADFTELDEPGSYLIRAGGSESGVFRIGEDALEHATELAMLGLYGQRCGESVELRHNGDTFKHGECHLAKAKQTWPDATDEVDDTGGWHDAGDYGKYVRNGAFAVGFLLQAYEHFPQTVS